MNLFAVSIKKEENRKFFCKKKSLVKSSKLTGDAKAPGSAAESPIKIGAGTLWDAVLAKFTRFTTPVDPQTAWDNYLTGNGSSGLFNFGNFSANLAVLKDNIQYSNVKLF